MQCQKEFTVTIVADTGCNSLPRLPGDGVWSEFFLSPGCTYTFDGVAGAAALVSVAASTSGARETDVCNSSAPYTFTVNITYSISGDPFTFPPIFEPRVSLTLSINTITVDTDTSPILADGSVGALSVNTVIPADSVNRNIRVTVTWNAVPDAPDPSTTATITLAGVIS